MTESTLSLPTQLSESWRRVLEPRLGHPPWLQLGHFLAEERARADVFPPEADTFNAFLLTPLERVRVLILGQDPYPTPGVAHGLAFSVRPGVKLPASLKNIYRELQTDLGIEPARHGCLQAWAERGVLLLNTCLTVRSGEPNSHAGHGWEELTDAAIAAVNDLPHAVAFVLWGAHAQRKAKKIDVGRHGLITSAHPSPLSARHGFFGSRPFSKANTALVAAGHKPIDWQLPEIADNRDPSQPSIEPSIEPMSP